MNVYKRSQGHQDYLYRFFRNHEEVTNLNTFLTPVSCLLSSVFCTAPVSNLVSPCKWEVTTVNLQLPGEMCLWNYDLIIH